MTMPTNNRDVSKMNYEELYTIYQEQLEDTPEERLERLRNKNIMRYRVKTIKSGEMLECEIYPIWNTPKRKRAKKEKEVREAQANLNDKNAQKHLIRLVNTNFTKQDIWLTLTYKESKLPADLDQAKRDMQNYIRRLKRYIKKNNLPELKYIYVTESQEANSRRKKRIHHHMIMNFTDRDKAEELWNGGGRTQSRRMQPDDFGFEGLARYISKEKGEGTTKRYTPSRNLKQPTITIADSKVTRRRAQNLATDENMAPEYFEKLYKNYLFKDMQVKYSPYVDGAYIYVRMKQIEQQNRKRRGQRKNE